MDSTADTLAHISKVRSRLYELCAILFERADCHDVSKLREPEKSGYDRLGIQLRNCEYGSAEYRAALDEAKPIITEHYANPLNMHHPEHYTNGINGMTLLDIVEMLADWKAASERTRQGSIQNSLAVNKVRFDISDQLAEILENTVKALDW